jgi:hypothetical protein
LRNWHAKYQAQGLVIIGVHASEFTYERDATKFTIATKALNIPYAVALDNGFENWNAFNVWAWPSKYILDKQGQIRFTHVGEGTYAESEQAIVSLLNE